MQLKQLDWETVLVRPYGWDSALHIVAETQGVDTSKPFAVWCVTSHSHRVRLLTTDQDVVERFNTYFTFDKRFDFFVEPTPYGTLVWVTTNDIGLPQSIPDETLLALIKGD